MQTDELKYVIEALLFASDRPLGAEEIKEAFEEKLTSAEIAENLKALKADYDTQNRGVRLCEIAGGFQFVTDSRLAPYLKKFYQDREKKKLSQASLETLSVIAYRQPVTRADIEFIRGVNVDGTIRTLLEKNLVKIVGRKEVPGRPMLYGSTEQFLDHFGLNSIKDLPALSEYTLKDIEPSLLPPELKAAENMVPDEKIKTLKDDRTESRVDESVKSIAVPDPAKGDP